MNRNTLNQLVREAAPTCSAADGQPDRYRVWLEHPDQVVKARTKAELKERLSKVLKERESKVYAYDNDK